MNKICYNCGIQVDTDVIKSDECPRCKTYSLVEINRGFEPLKIVDEKEEPKVPGGSTPEQYGLPPGARELQDLIEYRDMNFAIGNIFKACYRMGTCSHSDKIRDLNKILWFANRELAREMEK